MDEKRGRGRPPRPMPIDATPGRGGAGADADAAEEGLAVPQGHKAAAAAELTHPALGSAILTLGVRSDVISFALGSRPERAHPSCTRIDEPTTAPIPVSDCR